MGGRQEATGGARRRRRPAASGWPARRMTRDEVGPVERSPWGEGYWAGKSVIPDWAKLNFGPTAFHPSNGRISSQIQFCYIYLSIIFFSKNLSHNASLIIFYLYELSCNLKPLYLFHYSCNQKSQHAYR